jgi:hypothetical protein
MISKVRDKDNKANILCVQGAFSRGTSNDISGVIFQNYDDDSKKTYNIASVTARDAFGTDEINGIGELLFNTNTTGCNLTEKMRIKHNGQVCIAGTESFSNALLSVYGTTSIASNLTVLSNVTLGILSSNYTNITQVNGMLNILSQTSNTPFTVNQQGSGDIAQLMHLNQPQVTVSSNGYIGIGHNKSNPTKALDVNGDINFDGMIYQNNTVYPREPLVQMFNKCHTNNKEYTVLLSWMNDLSFSNMRSVKKVSAKSYVLPGYKDNLASSNTNYSLRVYDLTNRRVLAEETYSNLSPALNTMTLSNLSLTTLTELELQGKVGAVGSNLVIENMLLQYV